MWQKNFSHCSMLDMPDRKSEIVYILLPLCYINFRYIWKKIFFIKKIFCGLSSHQAHSVQPGKPNLKICQTKSQILCTSYYHWLMSILDASGRRHIFCLSNHQLLITANPGWRAKSELCLSAGGSKGHHMISNINSFLLLHVWLGLV